MEGGVLSGQLRIRRPPPTTTEPPRLQSREKPTSRAAARPLLPLSPRKQHRAAHCEVSGRRGSLTRVSTGLQIAPCNCWSCGVGPPRDPRTCSASPRLSPLPRFLLLRTPLAALAELRARVGGSGCGRVRSWTKPARCQTRRWRSDAAVCRPWQRWYPHTRSTGATCTSMGTTTATKTARQRIPAVRRRGHTTTHGRGRSPGRRHPSPSRRTGRSG
jgi:hypothetical protein